MFTIALQAASMGFVFSGHQEVRPSRSLLFMP